MVKGMEKSDRIITTKYFFIILSLYNFESYVRRTTEAAAGTFRHNTKKS